MIEWSFFIQTKIHLIFRKKRKNVKIDILKIYANVIKPFLEANKKEISWKWNNKRNDISELTFPEHEIDQSYAIYFYLDL